MPSMYTDPEVGLFFRYHLQLYGSMHANDTYLEVGMFIRYHLQLYGFMHARGTYLEVECLWDTNRCYMMPCHRCVQVLK